MKIIFCGKICHRNRTTSGLYPSVGEGFRHSDPSLDKAGKKASAISNALTIKAGIKRGVEDVPFKLSAAIESMLVKNKV